VSTNASIDVARLPGFLGPIRVAARLLAVVDALAVQGVLLYWVWTWPGHHGGLAGAVAAALLVGWACQRAARAAFAFDHYRWVTRHFAKVAALGLLLQAVLWLHTH